MKLEITVKEVAEIFKVIRQRPEQFFEMIRLDVRGMVGEYLTAMMNTELTHFLGREPYVRNGGEANHRINVGLKGQNWGQALKYQKGTGGRP